MPRGPKGQKRPADVIGNAVRVMEIATGQREEECERKPLKNEAAAELGRKRLLTLPLRSQVGAKLNWAWTKPCSARPP